ncbi:MAG: DUF2341 domain-containing protein, partial [Candidatus Moraniibacteriota bacterium]
MNEIKLKNNIQTKKTITISKKLWVSFLASFFFVFLFSFANNASAFVLADGGWERTATLTIEQEQVSATLANYPLLLTEVNLPSEMFDADGSFPANADGGDIRFSSDQFGATEIPREIISFTIDNDPANGKAEIYVKVASISATVDTLIYVWYHNPTATDYLKTDTYGENNTWLSTYMMVQHMTGSSATSLDSSTLNANDIVGENGTPDYNQTGKIGQAINVNSADSEYIYANDSINFDFGTGVYEIDTWINYDAVSDSPIWFFSDSASNIHQLYYEATSNILTYLNIEADTTDANYYKTPVTLTSGNWYHLVVTRTGATLAIYLNGASLSPLTTVTAITTTTTINETGPLELGRGYFNTSYQYFDGKVDEVRIIKAGTVHSATYVASEYNNLNNPATFVTEGASREALSPDIIEVDAGPADTDRTALTSNSWFNYSQTGGDELLSFSWTDPNSLSDDNFYYELNTTATVTIDGTENNTTDPYIDLIANTTEGIKYFHVRPRTTLGTWGTERIFIIKYDKTSPTGGSVTHFEGEVTGSGFGVIVNRGSDAINYSGMSTTNSDYLLEYQKADYSGGSCGSYGSWADANVSEFTTSSGYIFSGEAEKCYQFRYTVKDVAGNSATYTGSNTTKTTTSPLNLTDWSRKAKITIDHTKVAGDISNYQFKVSDRYLPYELKQLGGTYSAKSDGSDLRFSSDANGTSLLPFDIARFEITSTPSEARIVIWVRLENLSSTVDTDIWVWYHNPTASAVDPTATYGKYATWGSEYEMVYNFAEQGTGTTDDIKDSTSYLRHITSGEGDPTKVPVRGNGNGSNYTQVFSSDKMVLLNSKLPEVDNLTISVLAKAPIGIQQTFFDDNNNYWKMWKDEINNHHI